MTPITCNTYRVNDLPDEAEHELTKHQTLNFLWFIINRGKGYGKINAQAASAIKIYYCLYNYSFTLVEHSPEIL